MFAIIDIETTGGNPRRDKITEVAVYVHDGKTVVDSYQTLINPERRIPAFISRMTGITDEMVQFAPKFYEVAKDIVEITEGRVFVAHNVTFDYSFIAQEYRRLGFEYVREKLCTVQLSRKTFPGLQSYSLGKLCNSLNININNRHRAAGDCLATVKLFEMILDNSPEMSIKAYQIQVFGKVQRVGFRFYVQKGAEMYNVKGFAKNMADGSVFIEAEGDAEDMDTFKDYCKKGPDWSNVTGFQANEIPPAGYNQFEIKH